MENSQFPVIKREITSRQVLIFFGCIIAVLFALLATSVSVYPPGSGGTPLAAMLIAVPLTALVLSAIGLPKPARFVYGVLASSLFLLAYWDDHGTRLRLEYSSASTRYFTRAALIYAALAMGWVCYSIEAIQRLLMNKEMAAKEASETGGPPGGTIAHRLLRFGWPVYVIPVALVLAWFPFSDRRPMGWGHCLTNLKMLATALLNYESDHGRLPPAHTVDANGKPLHSWRTLILPYLDDQKLFEQIKLNEPWNSPHNARVTSTGNEVFHCPSDDSSDSDTSYVAVIGPGTAWESKDGTKLSDITDGPKNTILLVETRNSGIKWVEPRDLDLEHLPPGMTKDNLLKSLSNHPGLVNVVFTDGATMCLPDDLPWSDFEAVLTIAGGEKIDRERW